MFILPALCFFCQHIPKHWFFNGFQGFREQCKTRPRTSGEPMDACGRATKMMIFQWFPIVFRDFCIIFILPHLPQRVLDEQKAWFPMVFHSFFMVFNIFVPFFFLLFSSFFFDMYSSYITCIRHRMLTSNGPGVLKTNGPGMLKSWYTTWFWVHHVPGTGIDSQRAQKDPWSRRALHKASFWWTGSMAFVCNMIKKDEKTMKSHWKTNEKPRKIKK